MCKMKELYTIGQEFQMFDPLSLEFEDAVRIVDWLNNALCAESPAEEFVE